MRELTKLKKEGHNASFIVRKDELDLGMTESSKAELKGASGRPKTRMDKLLQDSAMVKDKGDTAKEVELRFLMNPISLEPSATNPERVGQVICKRTKLEGEPFQQKPIQTDETELFFPEDHYQNPNFQKNCEKLCNADILTEMSSNTLVNKKILEFSSNCQAQVKKAGNKLFRGLGSNHTTPTLSKKHSRSSSAGLWYDKNGTS